MPKDAKSSASGKFISIYVAKFCNQFLLVSSSILMSYLANVLNRFRKHYITRSKIQIAK